MGHIRIRDGLTTTGTPFTTPRSKLVVISGYPLKSVGEYLIMVGPRLFEGDVATMEPSTLVHEMTHVWQYKNGTLTQFRGFKAHAHYFIRGKLGGQKVARGGAALRGAHGTIQTEPRSPARAIKTNPHEIGCCGNSSYP
jgi:hypothetical protein